MIARVSAAVLASLLAVGVAAPLGAQGAPTATEPGASQLALANLPAKDGAKLSVSTPAFAAGGDIPFENTQYKGNVFPGLSWSAGPSGTKSYVIIMQDGDAMRNGAPIFHWSMVNIPASITKLDPKMTEPPAGAQYGPNIRGPNQPYMGPHTPAGPKHRYHLQVFALDTTIPASATSNYESLTGAMKGHVLASGEVIGLGQIMPGASH
ncbi:MAG TPA: YbhB/YbcL family Raf kinase inhibitor-like protein [Gemmatimonadaceae bacterium]|jgi:para-nitrobenzyl esterase|nr:YbhB/YbcL family Raf kinase inhibitor-like protein [Gemmatimonadaceae bacterium]